MSLYRIDGLVDYITSWVWVGGVPAGLCLHAADWYLPLLPPQVAMSRLVECEVVAVDLRGHGE